MSAWGTALVVGGSGALGGAIAGLLRERGHDVLATYCGRGPLSLDKVGWVRFDARDPDTAVDVSRAVEAPSRKLDVLVYAAGSASSKHMLADTPAEECAELFAVNALGLAVLWRALHPAARAGAARVVVISSQAALSRTPGNGPYSASKAALEAIALTLAKEEAGYGVRANVLSPSLIASPQAEHVIALKGENDVEGYYRRQPWGRALSLKEAAEAAVAVVCDEAWRYASGQILRLAADIPPARETT
jgi:NAD(P)-dependent dehydrogenase (short-subunit alcohol dehydrogenase family)